MPCFFAWQTALRETLPEDAATIVPWDAADTAARVHPLLTDAAAAAEHVARIRAASASLTWDATAAKALDVYELAVRSPARTVARLAGGAGSSAVVAARLEGHPIDSLNLPEDVYRALRALTVRPRLRRLLYGLLKATYTVGHLIRRRRLPERVV